MTALHTKVTRMALLAVCSAALTTPLAVFAQDAPPPPPPPAQGGGAPGGDMMARMQAREATQLQMMTDQLSLTADQQASIKQIFADRDAKMQAAFSSGGDMRSQMMTMRQESNAKIRAVLTPDQQTKFDAMQQQMGPRGGGGRGGNGGGGATPPPPAPQQ